MGKPEKIRLGELLLQQGLLNQDQLEAALSEQKRSGRKLGRIFIDKGYLTEDQIGGALARQLQIPFINLKHFNIKSDVALRLPETLARRFRAMLLEDTGAFCRIGMADPTDLFAYDELARVLKRDIQLAVVSESLLLQTIDRIYRRTGEISGLAQELGAEVLLVPAAFTLHTGKDHWTVLLRARAIEAQCWVVGAAQWGRHPGGRTTYGHSMVVDPWGTVVAECSDRSGVVVAELDRAYLRRVRAQLPSLRHRKL